MPQQNHHYIMSIQTMRGTTEYPIEVFDNNYTLKDIFDYTREVYENSDDAELPPIRVKPDEQVIFSYENQDLFPEDSPASVGIPDGGVIDISIDSMVAAGPSRPPAAPPAEPGPLVWDNTRRRVVDVEVLKRMALLPENKPHLEIRQFDGFHLELSYHNMRGIRRLDPYGRPVFDHTHKVVVTLSSRYPLEKPTVDFAPNFPLYHPNVNFERGNICYAVYWHELDADLCYVAIQVAHIIQFDPRLVNLDELDARMNEGAKTWFESQYKVNKALFPTSKVKLRNPHEDQKREWRDEILNRLDRGSSPRKAGVIGPAKAPIRRRPLPGQSQ
jgi:hypothetical protein